MPRKRDYRGSSRESHSSKVSDAQLVDNRSKMKVFKRTQDEADRHIFETKMGNIDPQLRFDYSFNILSMRGDWESQIKVITLYFPFIVSKKKCKRFEELMNIAFKSVFLAKT